MVALRKKDLCKIELSAELATFLMDHHFHLKVTDQSWLYRLGHLLDVFFTMHEVSFSTSSRTADSICPEPRSVGTAALEKQGIPQEWGDPVAL